MAFTRYTTELNGQRYAYLDEGEGPLVVFGHGVLADQSLFEVQIEALRDQRRVDETVAGVPLDTKQRGTV